MPKFGNLPIFGEFCATEVACNFDYLPIFVKSHTFSGC